MSKKSISFSLFILCILTVVYSPAIFSRSYFVLDSVQIVDIVERDWTFTDAFKSRGLVNLSFRMDHLLWGHNASGYRLTNLLCHLLTASILYLFLMRLKFCQNKKIACQLAIVLWLLHPLHTSCVTYVIQRSEIAASLCYVIGLYIATYFRNDLTRKHLLLLAAAWCLIFGIGTFSKLIIVSLPLATLLIVKFENQISLSHLFKKNLYLCLSLLCLLVLMVGYKTDWGDMFLSENSTIGLKTSVSPVAYLLSQLVVFWKYVQLIILPLRQSLDYGWLPITTVWKVLLALSAWSGVIYLFSRKMILQYEGALLCMLPLVVLSPTSSIMPLLDIIFEHRIYLASAFVIVFAVCLLSHMTASKAIKHKSILTRLCLIIFAAYFSVKTFTRNQVFNDPKLLWQQALAINPDHGRAMANLSRYYLNDGEFEQGLKLLKSSFTARNFPNTQTLAEYGKALMMAGRNDEAYQYLVKLEKEDQADHLAYQYLGELMSGIGKFDMAAKYFEQSLKKKPRNIKCIFALHWTYACLGKTNWAKQLLLEKYEKTGDLFLLSALAYLNAITNQQTVAQKQAESSIKLASAYRNNLIDDESYARSLYHFAVVYLNAGDFGKASQLLSIALSVNEQWPDARILYVLSSGLFHKKPLSHINTEIMSLHQTVGDHPKLLYIAALLQAKMGNVQPADNLFRKAHQINQRHHSGQLVASLIQLQMKQMVYSDTAWLVY